MINTKYKLLKNKTILYVEDDLELQEKNFSILSNFFKNVLVASDGDEAYDIYLENQNTIDSIITDINMPNTDGIELCKHIREYQKGLPLVIISAYTNTDYLLDSTVRYDMMYEYMWDYEKAPSTDAVKSFIRKLKRKLPIELFKNQKGEGYYLLK